MATIFYQNTTDGKCAAAIVKRAIHRGYAMSTNFGYVPNWSRLRFGEEVYLLGVLFNIQAMFDLNKGYKLTYIDHHESSLNTCKDVKFKARYGVMDTSESTAYLTWKYFFPDEEVPIAIQLISDYTLNRISTPEVIEFWEGLNSVNTRPDQDILWNNLFNNDAETISRIKERGKEIMEFVELENKHISERMIYRGTLNDHQCLFCNYRPSSSRFFNDFLDSMGDAAKDIDYLVIYAWLGYRGQWKATVFSNKIELPVTELVESYGGGGQPGVGSFCCDILPWNEQETDIKQTSKFKAWDYLNKHIIARQYKQMGMRSLYNQAAYYDVIGGFNCCLINTPEEGKQIFDYVSSNLPKLDLGITWCWENRGQYKVVIYPLGGNLDRDGVIKFIANLGYSGGATMIDDGFIFFCDILPIKMFKRDDSVLLTQ